LTKGESGISKGDHAAKNRFAVIKQAAEAAETLRRGLDTQPGAKHYENIY